MYRNRIREYRTVASADLQRNPLNFRRHPEQQKEALRELLRGVGRVAPLLAYEHDGALQLLDGHARLDESDTWDVAILDIDDSEAATVLAMLDKIGAGAEIDPDALMALLDSLPSHARQTAGAAWSDDELAALLEDAQALPEPGGGGDEFDVTPEDGPTRTALGELWIIGGVHRMLVGDCTDPANVARLMGGQLADMVFTDPPYGVDYVGKTKDALVIENDDLGDDGTRELVRDIMSAAPLRDGGSFYVCSPPGNTETAFRLALREAKLELRQCIVWVKQHFVMGRQDYHWRHESILYGWKAGAGHYFVDDRTQDTVWEIDRPMANADHPTMKPVELVVKAINNNSRLDEIVYDGCFGSGTTLIAAHRTGRRCYGMELSERYCDVILRRAEAEGLTCELVESANA